VAPASDTSAFALEAESRLQRHVARTPNLAVIIGLDHMVEVTEKQTRTLGQFVAHLTRSLFRAVGEAIVRIDALSLED